MDTKDLVGFPAPGPELTMELGQTNRVGMEPSKTVNQVVKIAETSS